MCGWVCMWVYECMWAWVCVHMFWNKVKYLHPESQLQEWTAGSFLWSNACAGQEQRWVNWGPGMWPHLCCAVEPVPTLPWGSECFLWHLGEETGKGLFISHSIRFLNYSLEYPCLTEKRGAPLGSMSDFLVIAIRRTQWKETPQWIRFEINFLKWA